MTTEATQTTETPTQTAPTISSTPEVPSQKAPDDLSPKFAALAKKERMLRMTQANTKAKEQALAERERQVAERERLWDEEFKKAPLEAIKKRGFTYEDFTKAALNDGKFQPETEIKEVRSELERFRQEQEEKEKKLQEQQQLASQRAEKEAVDNFKGTITTHVEANKDKYELTALYEAQDLVFQTIEEHYLRSQKLGKPKIMSLDEGCSLVESYLESEIERTATSSKKFQSKYQVLKAKEEATTKQQPRSSTTLTNDLVPTSAAPSMLPTHTENDRIKRALAALG